MFTGSSSSRSSLGALRALALALALLGAAGPAALAAASLELELAPAGDELFTAGDDGAGSPAFPAPEPGKCLVIFRYNRLSAGDLNKLTITAPDGRELPLFVEPLFVEFGKIADARMAFVLDAVEATDGRGPFTLKWGPEAAGHNTQVERIPADPARRELYRTLRPRAGAVPPDANIASLEVIADSSAEYHFLWYLLPMSLVFALLLVRKFGACPGDGGTDTTSP